MNIRTTRKCSLVYWILPSLGRHNEGSKNKCCSLRVGISGSGCRSPDRLRCDNLLEIQSPGRVRLVSLLRIGSLDMLRQADLLGALGWWVPEQIKV